MPHDASSFLVGDVLCKYCYGQFSKLAIKNHQVLQGRMVGWGGGEGGDGVSGWIQCVTLSFPQNVGDLSKSDSRKKESPKDACCQYVACWLHPLHLAHAGV